MDGLPYQGAILLARKESAPWLKRVQAMMEQRAQGGLDAYQSDRSPWF